MTHSAKQKGIALLMLVVIIALAFISYFMSGLSIIEIKVQQQEKTLAALNKAKQALLAYAMNYPDIGGATQGPGNMPCPDTEDLNGTSNLSGELDPTCTSGTDGTLDRFPWETLEAGELRDGSGELLWYAVSSNYVNVGTRVLNTSTPGQILMRNRDGVVALSGDDPMDAIVAVIIAPGETLVRDDGVVQNRGTAAELADSKNYLDIAYDGLANEEDNAGYVNGSAADGFIRGPVVDDANNVIVNDQFVTITYGEIMELVHARAATDIANAITDYVTDCGAYPVASIFDPTDSKAIGGYTGEGADASASRSGYIPVNATGWTGCAANPDNPLPQWVESEEWHKVTYYEYTANIPCTVGCLTVNNTTPLINNADALIIFAGRELAAPEPEDQDRVTIPLNMTDYFEDENNNGNTTYDVAEIEDYVYVIAP